ncbi:hypothetical protein [Deinococcus pimensis]|nr:hypothetical protein [Deinococcus pimensis]
MVLLTSTPSDTYRVLSDYETVYVESHDQRSWKEGDFYGDP